MLTKIFSATLKGIDAIIVTVEVNILNGAKFAIVGLPDIAIRESQHRIDSSLRCIGERIPGKRVIINMAPADVRKEGAMFDLPLAIGILAANDRIQSDILSSTLIIGELSLDGTLQRVKGTLPFAIAAKEAGFKRVIVPKENANEASVVKNIEVYGFTQLKEVIDFLNGKANYSAFTYKSYNGENYKANTLDFADVRGQENAKRALEIAACGSHNIILVGAPGSGKSMLSKRLPTILPPMTEAEALEVTKIHSVAGYIEENNGLITTRPFRTPHHSASEVSLIGGGSTPKPGEISLACNGCLYLDELPEFKRHTLELLRQPLEDGEICITRAHGAVRFPANFLMIASMNPCPCGYYNHPTKPCVCNPGQVQKYLNRISGPLLDRIDIQVEVLPVTYNDISMETPGESSQTIRERVINGREIQLNRFASTPGIYCNAQMNEKHLHEFCALDIKSNELLRKAMERLRLSARAYSRILKVARTIADLDNSKNINIHHIAEAIGYRNLDRKDWACRN